MQGNHHGEAAGRSKGSRLSDGSLLSGGFLHKAKESSTVQGFWISLWISTLKLCGRGQFTASFWASVSTSGKQSGAFPTQKQLERVDVADIHRVLPAGVSLVREQKRWVSWPLNWWLNEAW